jgi:tetratricopeptide (TPR) repeat protein
MLKLWGNIFTFILLSISLFGMDFERVCNEELLKEDFNISVVKESCLKTAHKELKSKSFANSSWYFLLAGKITKNIEEVQAKIENGMFVNIGHSYLLQGNLDKVPKYYATYIDKELQPNKAMLADFKLLQKLYPKKKKLLNKGLKIWNKLYKPLLKLDTLYHTYEREEKEENYLQAIKILQEIILLRINYSKKKTETISIDYNNLALLYGDFGDYTESLKYMLITLEIDKKLFNKEHHQIASPFQF